MENNQLVIKEHKRQSLEAWVDEINGMTFEFTYLILIQISRTLNEIHLQMD